MRRISVARSRCQRTPPDGARSHQQAQNPPRSRHGALYRTSGVAESGEDTSAIPPLDAAEFRTDDLTSTHYDIDGGDEAARSSAGQRFPGFLLHLVELRQRVVTLDVLPFEPGPKLLENAEGAYRVPLG